MGDTPLITLPRPPNITQNETPMLVREEEDGDLPQNSTGVDSGDGLGFLYHEVLEMVEGVIGKIF